MNGTWVNDQNAALLTDFYELTMLQSYFDLGMDDTAVFDLFVRQMPSRRNYLVACGLESALRYLETLRFTPESLDYLRSIGSFTDRFLEYLADFQFTGDVYALPEGTVVFAGEPIVEVVAPILQAQLAETFLMNQIHVQTLAASKAARVVEAAAGRVVVDFGLRRMHGTDSAIKAARAFYVAGVAGTSNVLAGKMYGIPVVGTMAHSYIQAHKNESLAFRRFIESYPETTLLVDTYDTLKGVQQVVDLAQELGPEFRVRAIRLDSGNLVDLSRKARRILDAAGLGGITIFASSSLDEYAISEIVASGAPIAGFGVGVKMAVSEDAPYLDTVYKLVEYAGEPRMKLSQEKSTLPGRKQVFRQHGQDIIGLPDEKVDGNPLLVQVITRGNRTSAGMNALDAVRSRARSNIDALPARLRKFDRADPPYPVQVSPRLRQLTEETSRKLG